MPVTRFTCAILVTMLIVPGCSARQDPGGEIPIEEIGRFSFLVETRDGMRMTGFLDVTLDTIVARSESAPCRFATEQPNQARLAYECVQLRRTS